MGTDVFEALRAALGEDSTLSQSPEDLRAHSGDQWPRALKWTDAEAAAHLPACIVRPKTAAAVASILRIASQYGVAVAPYGAGSSVTGAAVADAGAIVIDLQDLARIADFSAEDNLVRVEAGCMGGELEVWLNERGYTLGHYPQSLHISTVGGWTATRSTGTFSAKYGGIETLVAGLEVVLPDGRVLDIKPVPRSASGPGLMGLFLGAEGRFGIVTRVDLRVIPQPEAYLLRSYAFADLNSAMTMVKKAFDQHFPPALIRLYDAVEARHVYAKAHIDHDQPLLIVGHVGQADCAAVEADVFAKQAAALGGTDIGPEVAQAWDLHRYSADWFDKGNLGPNRMADSIEISAAWSQLLPLYDEIVDELGPVTSEIMAHWSHFYPDGAGMYVIFSIEDGERAHMLETYQRIWDTVMNRTLARGGSISHHHGCGLVRAPYLEREHGETALSLLSGIKSLIDPGKILKADWRARQDSNLRPTD